MLTNGCTIWGAAANNHLNELQRLPNKVLRVIVRAPRYIPRSVLHEELSVEPILTLIANLSSNFYASIPYHSNPKINTQNYFRNFPHPPIVCLKERRTFYLCFKSKSILAFQCFYHWNQPLNNKIFPLGTSKRFSETFHSPQPVPVCQERFADRGRRAAFSIFVRGSKTARAGPGPSSPEDEQEQIHILPVHWCAKIKDEVEKLAYQLNEEAERTERPITRLSKVMYGSTCADMQVDVMGECLSSIKHVVGTTSGCFYPRSNHWEVGGRPQCDKCGCRVRNCSQHRFTTLETISNYRNSYPGFSSGRPRGTTPADDRYIVLQARRNRRQTAGEIARHTTQATGRPISRFTVARRLHGGGLFARRPVRCVSLTPAHRRRRSLWCREHRNWRDNEWGRVLFTDESRFSLSSDSHRILIWRERGSHNHLSNIIERDRYGGRGVLVWGGIMLGSRTDLHIFDAGSVNGTHYCNEILPYVRLFRGAMGLQFLFMDDNAPCHRTVAAEQLLESRRLAARTLPPVTIRELRLALQDEWAAMPQQLIDTLILSMGRRCETCLAVRGDHIPN
ncbi:transposable element Tcb2 transposase [Trichonephila clavipes]|nr:transposable element Tcb2 transposase [Trichonephila clavipes]